MVTAPETSRTLPGICGTWAVRMPYVNQVAQGAQDLRHHHGHPEGGAEVGQGQGEVVD